MTRNFFAGIFSPHFRKTFRKSRIRDITILQYYFVILPVFLFLEITQTFKYTSYL